MSFATFFVYLISFSTLFHLFRVNAFGKIRYGHVRIARGYRDATAATMTSRYSSVSNEPAISNGANPRAWTNRKIAGEKEPRFVHPQVLTITLNFCMQQTDHNPLICSF